MTFRGKIALLYTDHTWDERVIYRQACNEKQARLEMFASSEAWALNHHDGKKLVHQCCVLEMARQ